MRGISSEFNFFILSWNCLDFASEGPTSASPFDMEREGLESNHNASLEIPENTCLIISGTNVILVALPVIITLPIFNCRFSISAFCSSRKFLKSSVHVRLFNLAISELEMSAIFFKAEPIGAFLASLLIISGVNFVGKSSAKPILLAPAEKASSFASLHIKIKAVSSVGL